MTYYRIVKTQMVDGDQYAMDGAMYMGRLVPVEPCIHGKIDSHLFYVKYDDGVQVYHPNGVAMQERCPGAGVGEETP